MTDATEAPGAVVLVVEDEPLQRMDMTDLVERGGFTVIQATNADHAIAILEARSDICVVFTDIDMPGSFDGLRLAAAVARRWPPIRIIVTTAGTAPDPEVIPDGAVFLPKPLDHRLALATVRRLLG